MFKLKFSLLQSMFLSALVWRKPLQLPVWYNFLYFGLCFRLPELIVAAAPLSSRGDLAFESRFSRLEAFRRLVWLLFRLLNSAASLFDHWLSLLTSESSRSSARFWVGGVKDMRVCWIWGPPGDGNRYNVNTTMISFLYSIFTFYFWKCL